MKHPILKSISKDYINILIHFYINGYPIMEMLDVLIENKEVVLHYSDGFLSISSDDKIGIVTLINLEDANKMKTIKVPIDMAVKFIIKCLSSLYYDVPVTLTTKEFGIRNNLIFNNNNITP